MNDPSKAKQELIEEIASLKQKIMELEQSGSMQAQEDSSYGRLINNLQIGVYIVQDGRLVFANQYCANYSGYAMDELIDHEILGYVHAADRQFVREKAIAMLKGEQTTPYEYRMVDHQGNERWLMEAVSSIDYRGEKAVLGNIMDVTEFRKAQVKLNQLEELERSILAAVPHALFGVENRCIFFANDAMENIFGWKPDELLGQSTRVLFRNEREWREYGAMLYSELEKRPVVVFEWNVPFVRKDGREIFCRNSVSRIGKDMGGVNRIVATFEDITDRRRSEEALRDSQQRLSDIIDFLPDATLVLDKDGRIIAWNRAIEAMTGVRAEEMLGMGNQEHAIPFYGHRRSILIDLALFPDSEMEKRYTAIKRSGDILFGDSFVPNLPSGHAHLSATASVLRDTKGNIVAAIECIRDNTQRRKADEALKESEEHYRLLFESAHDAVLILGDGRFLDCNRTALEMFGCEKEQLVGKTPWHFSPEHQPGGKSSSERAHEIIAAALEECSQFFEWKHCRYDGSLFDAEVSLNRFERGNTIFLQTIVRDITDRKRAESERRELEERLQRSEKMEALGMLAGGVAHDLNNALGILVGYSELLADDLDRASPLRSHVDYIKQGGERASAIVQDLLTLARRGVQTRGILFLNTLIEELRHSPEYAKLCSFHPGVSIETALAPDLLNIKGSSAHLYKTVMNLASNAAEAMPAGGRMIIATANRYLDRPVPGYDHIQEGDYVVLSVSDTGDGISKKDLKKIFEPFYTKKVMGRSGTGLGLAVVWGTVKDHGGYVNVQSEKGKGSTFSLYFPVTREEAARGGVSIPVGTYLGKGESILVVDDVPGQRDLAAQMLTKLNYRVASAASGEEAVKYLKKNKADLLVLDMIMDPGMDGLDTYREILKLHSKQKAIIVSGFSESDRVRRAQALGAGAYVRKPYASESIGSAVRKELDR